MMLFCSTSEMSVAFSNEGGAKHSRMRGAITIVIKNLQLWIGNPFFWFSKLAYISVLKFG